MTRIVERIVAIIPIITIGVSIQPHFLLYKKYTIDITTKLIIEPMEKAVRAS